MEQKSKKSWPFDASEASERSKNAGMRLAKEEIEELGNVIMDACSRGEYSAYYEDSLSQQACDFLDRFGYKYWTNDFGKSYRIEWKKAE